MYVLIFYKTFVWNVSHSNKNLARYDHIYIDLRVKFTLFLSNFNETWTFSTSFRKILKYQIPWKSAQWDPCCSMRTGGQTYMMKLIMAFRNFSKVPKKYHHCRLSGSLMNIWEGPRLEDLNESYSCIVGILPTLFFSFIICKIFRLWRTYVGITFDAVVYTASQGVASIGYEYNCLWN
jgi:hypothetical protein